MDRNPNRSFSLSAGIARSTIGAFLGGLVAVAAAQSLPAGSADLQARMDAAQAAAPRPGDAALSCEQLEKELVSTARDPALQSYVATSGAQAKQDMDKVNAAAGRAATQTALTLMSSVVPGGAMAGFAGMAAQGPAQQADAARHIEQRMQQMQGMLAILPQLMRGHHVIELAQARRCDWAK